MAKFIFGELTKDEQLNAIFRAVQDNFISIDRNGNVEIPGKLKANEVESQDGSVYVGLDRKDRAKLSNDKGILKITADALDMQSKKIINYSDPVKGMLKQNLDDNKTILEGYGSYVPDNYEITDGHYLEIEDAAVFEIG